MIAQLLQDITQLYARHIIANGKQPQAMILLAFLVTFCLVRWITYRIHTRRGGLFHDISIGGKHVHHLVWGIFLILITGYLMLAFDPPQLRNGLAFCFGIGAALTLDEFALWLRLEDVYWTKEGRWSVDVAIIVAVIFGLALVGWPFWHAVGLEIVQLFGFG